MRLFTDRAQAVRPDLDLKDENLARIVDVCRRLDGVPLAIELVAARLRSLNPADLAARIGDRFGLLTSPRRTTVARHRTLRALVDWSYALLSTAEQQLFDRLSVFSGGFTLAAAEQVCEGDSDSVVDLLAALVDSSLVGVGPPTLQVRYSLLETLRAYGRERLEGRGERGALRRAHAVYYAALAEEAGRGLRGQDEGRWVAVPDADAHPLFPVVCGGVGEGLTVRGELQRALALAGRGLAQVATPDDRRRLPLLKVVAAVALYEGRLNDCFGWAGERLRPARRDGDAWYVAEALLSKEWRGHTPATARAGWPSPPSKAVPPTPPATRRCSHGRSTAMRRRYRTPPPTRRGSMTSAPS